MVVFGPSWGGVHEEWISAVVVVVVIVVVFIVVEVFPPSPPVGWGLPAAPKIFIRFPFKILIKNGCFWSIVGGVHEEWISAVVVVSILIVIVVVFIVVEVPSSPPVGFPPSPPVGWELPAAPKIVI